MTTPDFILKLREKAGHDLLWLVGVTAYDPVYGARPLKRYLQKHVETQAAKLILADKVRAGNTIVMDVKDGKLEAFAE